MRFLHERDRGVPQRLGGARPGRHGRGVQARGCLDTGRLPGLRDRGRPAQAARRLAAADGGGPRLRRSWPGMGDMAPSDARRSEEAMRRKSWALLVVAFTFDCIAAYAKHAGVVEVHETFHFWA